MAKNGLLIPNRNLAYYFIPKVMCTSLKKFFADDLGLHYKNPHVANFAKVGLGQCPENYTSFAIVRNPFARFVSLYLDKIRPNTNMKGFTDGVETHVLGKYGGKFNKNMSFEEFVSVCLVDIPSCNADDHWALQRPQVWGVGTDEMLNHYFKIEDLGSFYWFLKLRGLDFRNIPRSNPRPRKKEMHWVDFYQYKSIVKLVNDYYHDDLVSFGYESLKL